MTHPQSPLRGIFWMVITGFCFVGVAVIVKHMGGRLPAAQSAFIRYAIGLLFLIPMIPAMRREGLSRSQFWVFMARGGVHSLGVILWFYAMGVLPVAEVSALNYATPVFVTIGAALFLSEKIALRRLVAIGVAIIGVVIILRPGFRDLQLAHISMIGTVIGFAGSYLLAKRLADQVSATMVVGMLSVTVFLGLAPFAIAVWQPPSMADLAWLFLVACFATAGHFTMTMAFAAAPIAVTQPVTFLQLVWSVLAGVVFFGDPLDGFVIFGGVLIFAAAAYIALREAQLRAKGRDQV